MTLEVKVSKKLVPYDLAYKELRKRVDSIKKHKSTDLLWILEHPLTYTGGIRSDKKEILDKKIKITKTNRGGKITLHNPGQKIVYLALDLNKRKKDIRNLVKNIEKSIIEFLKIYKINSFADRKNIGIWVNKKKNCCYWNTGYKVDCISRMFNKYKQFSYALSKNNSMWFR
jgi:lipoyl(octanoyl) transferase